MLRDCWAWTDPGPAPAQACSGKPVYGRKNDLIVN